MSDLILGLNAFHGDAAAALLVDGALCAALEEERLSRIKHAAGFPTLAARWVLSFAGKRPEDLTHVAVSRDPAAHLLSKALYALSHRPSIGAAKDRISNAGRVHNVLPQLAEALGVDRLAAKVHNVEHHRAHMASTYYASPFDEAAVLSIDGFGDFVSTMMGQGRGQKLEPLSTVEFPHSLGILYTAATQFLGFPHYGDEWKLMGLAPYGQPRYLAELRRMLRLGEKGQFELDLSYFRHASEGVEMTWDAGQPQIGRLWTDAWIELLGPARTPEDDFYGKWADLAASVQALFEDAFFVQLAELHRRTGSTRLCLAGGCALNSTANGKIYERTPFKEVFITPACADDGTALGAALWVEHMVLDRPRRWRMEDAFTGPGYSDAEIEAALGRAREQGLAPFQARRVEDGELFDTTAAAIGRGAVVGWFQGRTEWGPRALGNRSIVADPRRADMKDILNQRIKRRETFRPFAPSVLAEHSGEWFERDEPSPFMLMVYKVRAEKRELVPAVTHVDGTGRLQTVDKDHAARYWALIDAFLRQTGVPMVLNTSFNEHEPIVNTPDDALACFLKTKMDLLAVGNWLVERAT